MSESEKYEAQGRAHANLKEAKSTVATIKATLQEYVRCLEETSRSLTRFLAYTDDNSHLAHSCKEDIKSVSERERICGLVDQLVTESKRVAELQKQVDRF